MQLNFVKASIKSAVIAVTVLLLGAGVSWAQQQVNLTASASTLTMPDGSTVPMWGYSCDQTQPAGSVATCAKLNPTAAGWSPVVITVPTTASGGLSVQLTNSLPSPVPTSLMIVGQLGGGLGTKGANCGGGATCSLSPTHDNQGTTWPIANTGAVFTPPSQGTRIQSFGTEVASGGSTVLPAWGNLRPGTYLMESGTHPSIQGPMGLYGILVVTTAPAGNSPGTAYPNVSYSADIPLLFSEIDPVQNNAVSTAVSTPGFSENATIGPYLGGAVASIAVTNGGSGYTSAPTVTFSPIGATGVATIDTDPTSPTYKQLLSIDAPPAGYGGNYKVAPQVIISGGGGSGASAVSALQLQANAMAHCQLPGGNSAPACYPPAVNYTPLYYLINGVAFNRMNGAASSFPAIPGSPQSPVSGNVLIRMVNAGLRMHVPSVAGAVTGTSPAAGFSLIAEDGNTLPGVPRVQSEVFMAAGKTYDVMMNVPASSLNALPVFDRQLSLSGNSISRDAGMLAYISVNGAALPSAAANAPAVVANDDSYSSVVTTRALTVSDPTKGVVANDVNVYNVRVVTQPTNGTVTLNADGTFTYTPCTAASTSPCSSWATDSFVYQANGSGPKATVTLGVCSGSCLGAVTANNISFTSTLATYLKIAPPGILANATDTAGYPLTVSNPTSISACSNGTTTATVSVDANGGFVATSAGPGNCTFTYKAQNSQGTVSSSAANVMLTFPQGSGLAVTVLDGADKKTQITDYRWIIEEDRTFYVDPHCTTNPPAVGCPGASGGTVPNFGTNFHTSSMPVIATGCTGPLSCEGGQMLQGLPVVCDQGNGICRPDSVGAGETQIDPKQVQLDPNRRYYISVLPGDAANPFNAGYGSAPVCSFTTDSSGNQFNSPNSSCGHGMGGAPINAGQTSVMVMTQPSPYPPATLTVFVFEDDYPLNGEHDAGGGLDVLSPNEPGLGGFEVTIFDDAGGTGDATGQPTYDMFNMPLTNSLAGTVDPLTKLDACPISPVVTSNIQNGDGSQKGIVGMIVTCPTYESDGVTLSPLAGQAVVPNLYQGRYGIVATPGADRIARGEEWLQTNTLDGQKAHDSFMRIAEPGYFQEFGPAGYHVTIGFANPKIINDRLTAMCTGNSTCNNSVKGHITTGRMSRTPDERLYGSGTHDSYSFTQCYVSLGDPDGEDFAFSKCDADGNFSFSGIPTGNWKITTFDQWNDQVVDGISTPIGLAGNTNLDMKEVAVHQWQANIYTRTCLDVGGGTGAAGDGVCDAAEPGLPLVATNVRFRDGSFSNFNNTDLNGYAGFNEVFPLFNWYVVETDTTRFKTTGVHVVYDAGGPADGTTYCGDGSNGYPNCGGSSIGQFLANTFEQYPLPFDLQLPGSVYCDNADCAGFSVANGANDSSKLTQVSTGRIDPPYWWGSYGWQGFSGQNNFLEWGKKPYTTGENGGIHGHVVYASTRPFDDPKLLLQLSWEPLVAHVRVNLYKEGFGPDGVTPTLTLVDHTDTSSFDDWAQGFRKDASGNIMTDAAGNPIPNISCPGQSTTDPFFYGLQNQPEWMDIYNNGAGAKPLAHNSQFKCYDGMHNWNQLQPAPYDGIYSFPSVTNMDPATGKPTGTNCHMSTGPTDPGCTTNPDSSDPYRFGAPMLPDGKYVVEIVVPPGYELVKEEDKNILIGDNFIAPVTQQFGGLGSIFIMPDQAEIASAYGSGNPLNPQNATQNLGRNDNLPSHEGDTGSVETFWPCVGAARQVPDFISLFPGSAEVAPFAGATRNLCDRKEVTLTDQTSALAKFYIFTSTHKAAHFTGVITDDFTAEFDPFSPQFGEKFAPAYLPVSIKDWTGTEIARTYSDAFGSYNGLSYSTWEVNPPNPTGYGPTMMVVCMNDAGPVNVSGQMVTDPLFQPGYSQFCYELPFMPGQTGYFDTPVVPTSAFAEGYNHPDCSYPDATPAIKSVVGSSGVAGPWVSAPTAAVTNLTLTAGGTGYTSSPAVTITSTDGNGTGATGSASLAVSSISIAGNRGTGYTSLPTISFNPTGATATVNDLRVVSVSVPANDGTGYTSTPTVTFALPPCTINGSTCVRATAGTVTRSSGHITAIAVANPGAGYTSVPAITITGGGGTGATATARMGVNSTTVTSGGTYSSRPTVSFSGGGATTQASGTANMKVGAVSLTNGGSGYDTAPNVGFSGGGGTGAAATASLGTLTPAQLTITALGDQPVENYGYTGPSASQAPFNQQRVVRHYNFGSAPTTFTQFPAAPTGFTYSCNNGTATTLCPYVTIGGQPMSAVSWSSDGMTITGNVPTSGVPACDVQQQSIYGGSNAFCGQLVITAANLRQSIDTVTVTIGGSQPYVLQSGDTIQSAIDKAKPGDMIIVPPGTYNEMVLMWKPVRLQGVGAESSFINANPHPQGFSTSTKLDPWRQQVQCLFGLAPDGTAASGSNPANCPSGMKYVPSGNATFPSLIVDRIPMEGVLGWDTSVNGNLAEQLIEPSLMGAYEGAAITVLGKGVNIPSTATDPFGSGATESAFPNGSVPLTARDCLAGRGASAYNPYPSNFLCNPSSIDGLSLINSSQGGGGIFVHAWGHHLQIANNRVHSNQGTLSGGITIGQGEHTEIPVGPTVGNATPAVNVPPGSCLNTGAVNLALPYCYNLNVNVHNNAVTGNSSLGDELFSSTPAGAGGVSFCNGADYYKFSYNWVCGNMNTGDGAGVAHIGFSYYGTIDHNLIMFNQTTNPTIATNGGGLLIMGAPDPDPACGSVNDKDCVSAPGSISPSDGTGPGLVINANLIMGNSADSGSGGGLRLQHINGTDVLNFPRGNSATSWPGQPADGSRAFQLSSPWNAIQITNNIIANNVAGWDGGGVALLDALNVDMNNNTIVSNDSTASSGDLFNSLFAPLASASGPCPVAVDPTTGQCPVGAGSTPQPAGLVSITNSAVLSANMQQQGIASFTCPANHGGGSGTGCTQYSAPALNNDVIYQNRTFVIGVGALGTGTTNQQFTVTLKNGLSNTTAASQTATGQCVSGSDYWDIGVRGDTSPKNHNGGLLVPAYSVLTDASGYGASNLSANPNINRQYCNGSRIPPEACASDLSSPACYQNLGWQVPPGTNESNALPIPQFSLSPSATTDEGNNWINLRWGPLSMSNPNNGNSLSDFTLTQNSPAIDYVPTTQPYPTTDFFGKPRPDPANNNAFDVGAIEYQGNGTGTAAAVGVSPSPLNFGNVVVNQNSTKALTLQNVGVINVNNIAVAFTGPFSRNVASPGTCVTTLAAGASCTINVVFAPTAIGPATGSATVTATDTLTGTPAQISGSPVTLTGTGTNLPVTVSPTSRTFGSSASRILRGTVSSTLTVTLTNPSGNPTLTGISLAFAVTTSGTGANDFQRSTTSPGTCQSSLPAGQNCTIGLVFAPASGDTTSPNPKAGTLTINNTAGLNAPTVSLTGWVR